ncbi:MAG: penicillin-binding protein 2 [Gammaproteobacteria bacterium]
MSRRLTIKDVYHENRLFLNRVVIAFAGIIVCSIGLTARLVYLQVAGHEHYSSLSKNNRVKISPLAPTRGLIYDRHGEVLAENVTTYSLEIIPEQVEDLERTLRALQKLLEIDDEEIQRFRVLKTRSKNFSSIPLLLRLNENDLARFSVRRLHFPGVEIHARLVRRYPYADLIAHVIGYVGRINEEELKEIDQSAYQGTNHIGKIGIEKSYETVLHGKAGYEEVETNAQGRLINFLGNVAPIPGADVHLSLDIDLQRSAYEGLGEYNGAVVAIEPNSGNVLVFVSKPGFDPNPFVYGIGHKDYAELQGSPDRPLFNRALHGVYPPGSTVKPFIGLAGLENGVRDVNRRTYCPGYYQLPGSSHKYRDWKRWGHGYVDLHNAIVQSCDVYYYNLAHDLGINRLAAFLAGFGFGQKNGIDLPGEKSGLLPSPEWKRRVRNRPWYPGETLITGIGQGFFQVTPLQLAEATAILANRGRVLGPHLVTQIVHHDRSVIPVQPAVSSLPLDPRNVEAIIDYMVDVVHSSRGTAHRISQGIPYKIAGKTGTAQVFTVKQEETYKEHAVAKKLRDHALFIAFAPADDPRIAIAVIVENGGHGGAVAAPIAGQVIDQFLRKESS